MILGNQSQVANIVELISSKKSKSSSISNIMSKKCQNSNAKTKPNDNSKSGKKSYSKDIDNHRDQNMQVK
jgi:hypothetical protein